MPKVTEAHVQARKEQILKAAFHCFSRKGFQKTTMQEICREAELSPGAVYLYFRSKEEIIEKLSNFYADQQRPLVASTVRVKKGFAKALSWWIGQLLEFLKEPEADEAVRLDLRIWSEAIHNQTLRDLMDESMKRIHDPLMRMIQRGQEAGELDAEMDASSAAYLLLALVIGVQVEKVFTPTLEVDQFFHAADSLIQGDFNRSESAAPISPKAL
jgi:AcrR family transcriptional regulator